jgi:hypothetical protein
MKPSQRSMGILALAALAAASPAANAQSVRVGVVTAVQGQAVLSRASLAERFPLRRRDDLFLADRITTGDRSFTRLLLGGKALVTVRERSTLTITEAPGTSVVDVAAGAVAVAVVKERMKPGEMVEIRTPNAVAGIRGTVVIAEVEGTDEGGTTTTITVLRGLVEVQPLQGPAGRPIGQGVYVGAAQTIRLTTLPARATPVSTPIQALTPQARQRLQKEWQGRLDDEPAAAAPVVESQKREAAALIGSALGPGSTLPTPAVRTDAVIGAATTSPGESPTTAGPTGPALSGPNLSTSTTISGGGGGGGGFATSTNLNLSAPNLSTSTTISGGGGGGGGFATSTNLNLSAPNLSTSTTISGGGGGGGGSSAPSGSGFGLGGLLNRLLPGK